MKVLAQRIAANLKVGAAFSCFVLAAGLLLAGAFILGGVQLALLLKDFLEDALSEVPEPNEYWEEETNHGPP